MSARRKSCSSREGTFLHEFAEIRRRLDPEIVNHIALGAMGLSGAALEKFATDTVAAIAEEISAADPRLAPEACLISASAHVRAGLSQLLNAAGGMGRA